MPYLCKDCRAYFSVRKGTAVESSKIGFQDRAIAFYMITTGIKGTSSMKLYREAGIRQATAWLMMQRIHEGFMGGVDKLFPGPVETGIGRGTAGKAVVAGVKDCDSRKASVAVVHGRYGRQDAAGVCRGPRRENGNGIHTANTRRTEL